MATSIDDVLAALDQVVDDAIDRGDRRGYFAALYRRVTAVVKRGVEDGFFDDPARMVHLDAVFAQRYLDAVEAEDGGRQPTASWGVAFDAGSRWRPLTLQHLLLGINAHINLDLGIAAAEVAPGDQLVTMRRDFDRINAVLASVIAAVQEDLRAASPWLGLLDRIGARTQHELIRFSIVTARTGAWRFAGRLAAMETSRWPDAIEARDRAVADVGRRVWKPGTALSTGLLLVRLRERNDVAAVIRLLRAGEDPSLDDVAEQVDDPDVTAR